MRNPEVAYVEVLNRDYNLRVRRIERLSLGNDFSASVYKVSTEADKTYFLKVRRGTFPPATVTVPHTLYRMGLTQVVAPIPTTTHALYTRLDDVTLILYPYIGDTNGMDAGLSLDQWVEYGSLVRRIHAIALPADVLQVVPRETFTINSRWLSIIETVESLIAADQRLPIRQELAAFWQAQQSIIHRILDRTRELGDSLRGQSLPTVLCHADIHTANLLLDAAGQLFVVDWDQPIIAPKERDLMFVAGIEVAEGNQQAFFKGYGQVDINWTALAYYRYEWVVQEFADYAERTFLAQEADEATQTDALSAFKQLFLPNDVIDAAYACEAYLE
ncbi:MAG: aminoglycoside phosphotransferase family protein [Chloroflexi bacterium]|nr:aminoglycoside phosphotransferase family protein [Chloroflexota bacterium]MCC6891435.1 phosphotransferase [Anaerolineae bacterium]